MCFFLATRRCMPPAHVTDQQRVRRRRHRRLAPVAVGTITSFDVALAAIAGLLDLVPRRPITVFVGYRMVLAAFVAVLLLPAPCRRGDGGLSDEWCKWRLAF